MSLLKTAVKAKLPLIAIHTDDPRGIGVVVDAVLGIDVKIVKANAKGVINPPSFLNSGQVGIVDCREDQAWPDIGRWLEDNQCVLLLVNWDKPHPWIFDVGGVSVPLSLVRDFIGNFTSADPTPFLAAVAGLSLANIDRISRMAMAQFGEFTPAALRAIRREFFPLSRGLEELATDQFFYEPSAALIDWLKLDGQLLTLDTHPLLTPRGFLFSGMPGVGKSSGARFIAQQLKVPLYRLDMGSILSRWQGESDARLREALRQADSFAPCVLLLDEVEKLFEASDSTGVMPRLLSALLWWLQEHHSKVFTIMTTNNATKIPPELYRPGRIDQQLVFTGLLQTQVLSFIEHLAHHLNELAKVPPKTWKRLAQTLAAHPEPVSQAFVTEQVLKVIKQQVLTQSGG